MGVVPMHDDMARHMKNHTPYKGHWLCLSFDEEVSRDDLNDGYCPHCKGEVRADV